MNNVVMSVEDLKKVGVIISSMRINDLKEFLNQIEDQTGD